MQTIVEMIEESCRRFAGKAALRQKISDLWQEISYATLWTASEQIALGLKENGFKEGDHAALLAPSSPRWVIAYLGILKAGGVVIPIDKELKSTELRHILTDCDARVLFTDHPHLDTVLEIVDGLPSLCRILTLNPPAQEGDATFAPLRAMVKGAAGEVRIQTFEALLHDGELTPVQRRPSDIAVILYTSGTTGRAKGAMLSHGNIVSNIRGAVAHLSLDESIHTLSILPINHVFEQVCGILLPLSLGGTVSFCESLKKIGDNLAEVKPTFFLGVPALYRMFLDRIMKNIGAKPLSRLLFSFPVTRPLVTAKIRERFGTGTIFISGGAALDPAIAEGLDKLGLTLIQGYGITETSPIISAECAGQRRSGSVGRVLPGIEVRIDTPDDEMVGEILVRGPNVMQGYYRDPLATAEALPDGWYRTGDLGRLDPDGFLTICGRVRNLIITPNGKNVYPEEVENELLKSPYIAETMVYGRKVAPVTEEIHALIYPDPEALDELARKQRKGRLTAAEVDSLLRMEVHSACAGLANYKRVKTFTICGDEFPKTTTRKIKRFVVEADLLQDIGAPLPTGFAGPTAARQQGGK
ncbi:MAG: AMP-binding protein [Geobacteraceae bacterium]|jgi:long-chain acyl-CoA synthetase